MISFLLSKIWKYVIGLIAVFGFISVVFLKGRQAGKASEESKVKSSKEREETARQSEYIIQSRHDTDTTVQALPEAPVQAVASSDSSTAAGKLRDDGWTRD